MLSLISKSPVSHCTSFSYGVVIHLSPEQSNLWGICLSRLPSFYFFFFNVMFVYINPPSFTLLSNWLGFMAYQPL